MRIKRLINCFIPVSVCNFECTYCYIPQCEGRKKNLMPKFRCTPQEIRKALSQKRLGGVCFMNICGDGETLLPKETPQIIKELLAEGHIIEVVTNGVLTERFDEILDADEEILANLEFKFSYHYQQLKEKNLLDIFWSNVLKSKAKGCSFTIELTPHDELIPFIDEIKEDCIKHVGALCHITTAYNYAENYTLLTKLSRKEYESIWGSFDSPMFEYKMSLLGKKRTEYCYAGQWLMSVDIASGYAHQCYGGLSQNIFDNINKPIKWRAVGKHCMFPLCFNGHALMTFGAIPGVDEDYNYEKIRNRNCIDGTQWLNPKVKEAFKCKLYEANELHSPIKKTVNNCYMNVRLKLANAKGKVYRFIKGK